MQTLVDSLSLFDLLVVGSLLFENVDLDCTTKGSSLKSTIYAKQNLDMRVIFDSTEEKRRHDRCRC